MVGSVLSCLREIWWRLLLCVFVLKSERDGRLSNGLPETSIYKQSLAADPVLTITRKGLNKGTWQERAICQRILHIAHTRQHLLRYSNRRTVFSS
jgi:hypothetical protein